MKLIIDIPDTVYEAYKEWHKQGVSNVEQSLIALAMPYEERPQGEWIWLGDNPNPEHKWSCNKCGRGVKEQQNFCPNCGADMRKGGAK